MSPKEAAEAKAKQLAEAKARGASRKRNVTATKDLEWEAVTLEDVVILMEIFAWESNARYGFGISSDGQSVMGRVVCPRDAGVEEYAGMVAFCFGSCLEHAIRKVAQLHTGDYDAWWKKDSFAKD